MPNPLWPDILPDFYLDELRSSPESFRELYEAEFEEPEALWVIPHGSSLDYCQATIRRYSPCGQYAFVEGRRAHGWTPDGAFIKARVPIGKLTSVPSWHVDFLKLYDDPHHRSGSW